MARLADIYKSEKAKGGGLVSAATSRLKEKLDPRQMFDQSGLLAAMFPSIFKAYRYKPTSMAGLKTPATATMAPSSERVELAVLVTEINEVKTHSKISAKNSMVLPAMARDMNLVRQNIGRLVKLSGGATATKSDMFFKRASEREAEYESRFRREGGKATPTPTKKEEDKKESGGVLSSLLGIGASIATAIGSVLNPLLSILGKISDFLGPLVKEGLKFAFMAGGKLLSFAASGLGSIMKNILPFLFNPAVLGLLGVGGIAWLIKTLMENDTTPEGEITFAGRESGGPADLAQQQGPEGAPYIKPNVKQTDAVRGRIGVADSMDKIDKMQEPKRTFELLQDFESMYTSEGEERQKVPKPVLNRLLQETNPTLQGKSINKRGIELYLKEKYGEKRDVSFEDMDRKASGTVEVVPSVTPTPQVMTQDVVDYENKKLVDKTPVSVPKSTEKVTTTKPTKITENKMQISDVGEPLVDFIKQQENPKLFKEKGTSKAHWDFKQYSIGYGTKANSAEEVIDEGEADKRLRDVLKENRNSVLQFGKKYGYDWNENQLDALTSFVYNLGSGALKTLTNDGKRNNEQISEALMKYNKAGGKVLPGLTKRRSIEFAMFNNPSVSEQGDIKLASSSENKNQMMSLKPTPSIPTPTMGTSLASSTRNVADTKMQMAAAQPPIIDARTTNVNNQTTAAAPMMPLPSVFDNDFMKELGYKAA